MRYLFYTTSASAWEGLRKSIEKATSSIYLEMYIFIDDTKEANYLIELFCQKAAQGVRVRIVLDSFGSFGLSRTAIERMKKAGVDILFYKNILRRLHRKIVVIDERIGFLGGVNIHKSARLWNDLLIRLEGPIVRSLIHSFKRVYIACGGKDQILLHYGGKPAILGRTRTWLIEHLPSIRHFRLQDAYIEAFTKAEQSVTLVTPYFLPHAWLEKLLRETVRRGVRVEVIVPKTTDVAIMTFANQYYVQRQIPYGITFYETTEMTHAKVLMIDRKLALIGSNNLDALSFNINAEIGVFFEDKNAIADLAHIIEKWKMAATIAVVDKRPSFFAKVLSLVVRLFQPVM